jgi:hypothetical protein
VYEHFCKQYKRERHWLDLATCVHLQKVYTLLVNKLSMATRRVCAKYGSCPTTGLTLLTSAAVLLTAMLLR